LRAVEVRTIKVLDALTATGIISGYDLTSINVEQDSTTKTQVNVTFNYTPIWPVNTVILTFSTSFSIAG